MKRIFTIVFLNIATFLLAQNKYQNQYYFYENKGQIIDQKAKPNPEVKYLFNSAGLNVQIKKTGFSYDVYEVEKKASKKKQATSENTINPRLHKKQNQEVEYTSKYHRVDINLVNANTDVQIVAEGKSPDYENYYNLEHNPKGVEKVHRYQRIVYKNVYNNVDLVFFKPEDSTKTVEYNFLVHPGGKVSDIKMKFEGAKTKLKDGKLAMALRFGEMQENIPNSWIEHSGSKQNIAVNFKDFGNQTFGFDSEINTSDKTIVIDPVPTRIWGSFFGGSGEEIIWEMAADSQNNLAAVGYTNSTSNIATSGSYQSNLNGDKDAFIIFTNNSGQRLWSSYYGGPYFDNFSHVTFFNNKIYISADYGLSDQNVTYPNANFYYKPNEARLLSFNKNGFLINTKAYTNKYHSITLGSLTTDSSNSYLYIVGLAHYEGFNSENQISNYVHSSSFPIFNFITKIDVNNSTEWTNFNTREYTIGTTHIGENGNLCISGMAFSNYNIYISSDALQATKNYQHAGYYTEFNPNGTQVYGTYLGGIIQPENIFTARRIGTTLTYSGSNDFTPPYGRIIRKIDLTTGSTIFSKYYANISSLSDNRSFIDDRGNIYVWGHRGYGFTPTANAFNNTYGDIYLMKVDPNGETAWATYYGGYDFPTMTKGSNGDIFYAGRANVYSFDIATQDAFQHNFAGGYADVFLAKFYDCTENSNIYSSLDACVNTNVSLGVPDSPATYSWTGPNGFSSTLQNPIIPNVTLLNEGRYTCKVTNSQTCDAIYTIDLKINETISPSGNSLQNFCIGQNPTLGNIVITGQNIKWYNASNILLAQTTPLVDGETYYATQTISSCESINKLAVKVAVNNSSISASNYVEPTFCNDTTDDFKLINLNDHRTKLIADTIGLQFTFYDSNNQLVPDFTKAKLDIGHNLFNVEIKNTVGCSQWFTLEFNLNKKPKLSLPPEVEFCSGIDAELNAGDCTGCTFLWNTGETSQIIKTQTEGTYTVTVTTEKTCQNSASVVVKKAKLATIKNIQIENNLLTITMSEAGDYLYSDDNINWQISNQFKLENGNYTIYVKTKAGCIIDQRTISIFEIPNSFSPNADGINDTWKIKGLENYKDSQVIVLDRFGKKLFETKVNGIFEWNGKINGHALPTDTYWYIINVSDGRSFKGFLVLKNRN